ncbi:sulfite reductase subunit alpha [Pseudoxanthomonas suwonensis]|uniref:sulfite reductase subunit alpha n=1 Tax=Pseudoxanthomonas suwonensis TaxID=314722 RepID=UPI0004BC491D|nr:sulfite reductase flavoprotein subunit alpha [Pseudoxanthomonas suwonensis]
MSSTSSGPSGVFPWSLAANLLVACVLVLAALLLLPLHGDAWWLAAPRPRRWWLAGITLLAWLVVSALFLRRNRIAEVAAAEGEAPLLVCWASQTGFARELAERSAALLRDSGTAVRVVPLEAVDADLLAGTRRALFVASTTGEGDPPDHAIAFLRSTMAHAPALDLDYALLALGDRSYSDFCAFGRQLDEWLRACGARPLYDRVEVDNADQAALRHWQYELGRIGGMDELPDWTPPAYAPWILQSRSCLNPGSPGAPVFDLALQPADGALPEWQAGDVVEIGPRHLPAQVQALLDRLGLDGTQPVERAGVREPLAQALSRLQLPAADTVSGLAPQSLVDALAPLPHREYSIASVPGEGCLRLLVRRMAHPDGRPGLGSGWLCEGVAPGQAIDLRLRANPGFRPPPFDRPLILVGNGTGIAGLRAHLQARVAAGARGNWLLFGERSPDHDRYYDADLQRWQAEGWLDRVDLAWSRGPEPAYVQHRLRAAAHLLREWVDRGAAILVCGNATGMAPAVDAVLAEVLGEERRDALRAEGRYRRDVY